MNPCGSVSPHKVHQHAVCDLYDGHEGLHWKSNPWDGGGRFWSEAEVRWARKLRVRLGRWLTRDEPKFFD